MHVIYDTRLSERVPVSEVLPAEVSSWIDGYSQMGNPHCRYSSLAVSEAEAMIDILTQASMKQDTEYIKQFIDAGQPVFIPQYDKAPNVVPVEDLLEA